MENIIKIDKEDNVVVATKSIAVNQSLSIENEVIKTLNEIPQGHKVAIKDIEKGDNVKKYGNVIGEAKVNIEKGEWVHSHNLQTRLKGKVDYSFKREEYRLPACNESHSIEGFERKSGRVGIRNEIWIINNVGCINKVSEKIARRANSKYQDQLKKNKIDGVFAFPHPFGCSQLGGDLENTRKLLASLVQHPNAAGVLVLGLGCENNTMEQFKEELGDFPEGRVEFLTLQEVKNGVEVALNKIANLINYSAQFHRKSLPLSKLKIGLKCGGSDSFSGITANPLLGRFSDKLLGCGGSSLLSEVPEMFGAEQILMNRAKNKSIFNKIVELINDFKDYYLDHDQNIYENPSPGNKEGGITTLEEKSLGNIEKGGKGRIVDVIDYGERIQKDESGLYLLASPGNDLVSTTALAAAGAQLVLFTTGRGTPFGGPVPTVKISSNSELYKKKKNWIDFNAGIILEDLSFGKAENSFFEYILNVCSGKEKTNNEIEGYREIAIFKTGVTL